MKKIKYFKRHLKPKNDGFSWKEMHHFWTGIFISIVGFIVLFDSIEIASILITLFGLWLMIDDYIQHFMQRQELKKYNVYSVVSFWHWFPNELLGKKFRDYGEKI